MGEHASRNASEPDSASLGRMRVASEPTRMKPDTGGEATGKHLPGSPGWLGAARVERSVEEPGRPCRVGAKATNERREDITGAAALKGVGAKKRGNARGAKGPY
jgi:hypothetical protein